MAMTNGVPELQQEKRFTVDATILADREACRHHIRTVQCGGVAGGSLLREEARGAKRSSRADARRSREFDGGTETMVKSQLSRIRLYIRSLLRSQILSAAAGRRSSIGICGIAALCGLQGRSGGVFVVVMPLYLSPTLVVRRLRPTGRDGDPPFRVRFDERARLAVARDAATVAGTSARRRCSARMSDWSSVASSSATSNGSFRANQTRSRARSKSIASSSCSCERIVRRIDGAVCTRAKADPPVPAPAVVEK